MAQKKAERIKKRVFVPLVVVLLMLLSAGLGGMYWVQREARVERTRADVSRLGILFQDSLRKEADVLDASLQYYSRDISVRNAFVARNRDQLLGLARPFFETLHGSRGVTHFYLIGPDRRVFLRVHAPDRHGDVVQRFTLKKAMETREVAHGLELGKFGHLTLRVVHPWRVNGEIIGYLELGKEVSYLTGEMKRLTGADLFLSIRKKYLRKDRWLEGLHILGQHGNWGEFSQCVVLGRTRPQVPSIICRFLGPPAAELAGTVFNQKSGGRRYSGGVLPLLDAAGNNLGNIVALFDVTDETAFLFRLGTSFTVLTFLLALLLYLGFSVYLTRLDGRLVRLQEALNEALSEKAKELSQSSYQLERDILKRREVERQYRRLAHRNQLILEAAGQGIFGLDTEGRHTFVNPAAAKMLGYEPDELLGKNSHRACHHTRPDGSPYPEEECPIYLAFTDGKAHHVEEDIFWKKDGTSFWVEYSSTPLWEDEALAGAVVAFRDITPRKKAQDALEESEERYRAISITAQDAIILMNSAGNIVYWNPAARIIFGYRREEAMGRELHALIVPDRYREQCAEGIKAFRQTGQGEVIGKTIELTAMRKGGEEFPVELSLSAIRKQGEWWAVGVVRDISERVRAARDRETLEAQLRQSQKMEAIGTLAGGIAHDFNNILGAIMGYTELALVEGEKCESVTGHLTEIRRASKRAKDLVAHILTFSRQGEMSRQPMNVAPIVKEALKMLRASLPSTIEIRQDIVDGVGKILADPTQIHQILMNLCTNASHAMRKKGGVLEVSLGEQELGEELLVRDFTLFPGRYLVLRVGDTGHGMDQETMDHIFEPFFTSKARGEGTGMGLAVVHGIVKSHDGAVAVESKPDEGTTFTIYFPVIETSEGSDNRAVSAAPAQGHREKVLLVDDEAQLIELGRRILEYLGYEVITRTSSLEAVDLFRKEPHNFDLVITDQTMPGMTGIELARQILALRPDIPIVLCTGFSEVVSREQALAMGIKGYVMKPLSIHDLAETCRTVLEGK